MLYPLVFEPIYKRILWGGRRIENVLNRPLPSDDPDYAESWEISDNADDVSVVVNGPLAGKTLRELIDEFGEELLGERILTELNGRFPWLVKYLDAQKTLSVQVHPDDSLAARLEPGRWGKTEAWVVIAAEPDAKIYCGLRDDVDRETFLAAQAAGNLESFLHSFTAQPGDFVFVPAGTVHAIGAGVLLAEIQQTSDVTYRLYDWNRKDANGQPRELHVDKGVQAIQFPQPPVHPLRQPGETPLVKCDKFQMHRFSVSGQRDIDWGSGEVRVVVGLSGHGELSATGQSIKCGLGHSAVIPACLTAVSVKGNVELLMCRPGT